MSKRIPFLQIPNHEFVDLSLSDESRILYWPNWIPTERANHLYQILENNLAWEQQSLHIYGQWVKPPRLSAWYGQPDACYYYSGVNFSPKPMGVELSFLANALNQQLNFQSNSVLANFYRDGNDGMGWHSDDEKELGAIPHIASISLGEERRFLLKHRDNNIHSRYQIALAHGSLLLMLGKTQTEYLHSVPKTKHSVKGRINLTFRQID